MYYAQSFHKERLRIYLRTEIFFLFVLMQYKSFAKSVIVSARRYFAKHLLGQRPVNSNT